jgi:hypothetical protein
MEKVGDSADRPATELKEIEITPAMIEAGCEAYGGFDEGWDSLPLMLSEVFKAMCREAGLVAFNAEGFEGRR